MIAVSLFMGIIMLPGRPACRSPNGRTSSWSAHRHYHQKTLIAQLADAVFHDFLGLFLITGVTALILVLAQHRVQRLPGAGIHSGPRPLPAAPVAHPR